MTRLFVSDTSVLIELERGALTQHAFSLPHQFIVPDLLYKQELHDEGGGELVNLGLEVRELDSAQVAEAQDYQRRAPQISLPDAFALVLAKAEAEALLTGDQNLRVLAEAEAVLCRGALWLLDEMLDQRVASHHELYVALTSIARHPRCRLPVAEIRMRRQRWALAAELLYEEIR